MKKLAAILLMFVFVFNLFGYKLWVYIAAENASRQLTAAVENNRYSDDQLLVIKKQISLPYYNNTTSYTNADGEVEMDGTIYRYVKYRIYNNMLEMLCLPNTEKTNIKKAKDDYFSIIAGIQKNSTGKNKPADNNNLKKSFSDFELYTAIKNREVCPVNTKPYPALYALQLGLLHKASVEQPPDTNTVAV